MKKFLGILMIIALAFGFTQCTEEGEGNDQFKGELEVEMTDAASDDANIEGVFVTVAEVKVDGETYEGFSGKQTIDIMAYQNGNTKALGLGELETKSYNEISFVLDYEADASGNAPGCYVKTTDGMKHDLAANGEAKKEIVVNKGFDIAANKKTSLVLDFDLRKAIKNGNSSSSSSEYSFVTDAELKAAVRQVEKDQSGKVKGKVEGSMSSDERIIVYAYAKGTYDKDTETKAQGTSNIRFKNATTSAMADANGNYTLAFLQEGDYEVHVAKYKDSDNDGKFELESMLEIGVLGSLNANSITVGANADVTLNLEITGLIPIIG